MSENKNYWREKYQEFNNLKVKNTEENDTLIKEELDSRLNATYEIEKGIPQVIALASIISNVDKIEQF